MDVEGFDKLVAKSWMVAPIVGMNSIQIFMSKLKFLKTKIKDWVVEYKRNTLGLVSNLKQNLVDLDAEIDKGKGDDMIVSNRLEIINQIQGENKIKALETAQKAKIRWYVEGDENIKFFHGMLNMKRSQLNIRDLERNISIEEVKKAVWDCGMDKSPGPDGDMPKGCNSNFITLIPKIPDAKLVKDFRPISLIGSLYKIIT
nr:RNA-directed DNA polymerase, eukaryota [Tanacetum cinerariifolium]